MNEKILVPGEHMIMSAENKEKFEEVLKSENTPWYAERDREILKQVMKINSMLPPHVYQVRREYPKVGRNEPCSCGSGMKNKKCCNLK